MNVVNFEPAHGITIDPYDPITPAPPHYLWFFDTDHGQSQWAHDEETIYELAQKAIDSGEKIVFARRIELGNAMQMGMFVTELWRQTL